MRCGCSAVRRSGWRVLVERCAREVGFPLRYCIAPTMAGSLPRTIGAPMQDLPVMRLVQQLFEAVVEKPDAHDRSAKVGGRRQRSFELCSSG